MKYLSALLAFLLANPLWAGELRPLIFPGARVFLADPHRLLVTAKGGILNRALQLTTPERTKQLNVADRRLVEVVYVRGVPFVLTDAGDRRGVRLEWAVVTTFREGTSPAQRGGLVLSSVGAVGLALTQADGLGEKAAAVLVPALAAWLARPVLARRRGLGDLALELRPVQVEGRAAFVAGFERDAPDLRIAVGGETVSLRDLRFRADQADVLTPAPPVEDDLVLGFRAWLDEAGHLKARPGRLLPTGGTVEHVADNRPYREVFALGGAWFAIGVDGSLDWLRLARDGRDGRLRLTPEPVTLDGQSLLVEGSGEAMRLRAASGLDYDPRRFTVDPRCAHELRLVDYYL